MKDYSNYFKYPEVFVTDINHNIGKENLAVDFRGETHNYTLNKEMIDSFYERLTQQHLKVIANMTTVVNNKATFKLILATLLLASCAYLGYSYNFDYVTYGLGTMAIGTLGGSIINESIIKPNHKDKIETYAEFMENMSEFPEAIKNDSNIMNISKTSATYLSQEEKLCQEGLLEQSININFMDKANIEDLKKMNHALKIYKALNLPVEFIGDKGQVKKLEKNNIKK